MTEALADLAGSAADFEVLEDVEKSASG